MSALIRSDNSSKFTIRAFRQPPTLRRIKTLYIVPGSLWKNGHVESFDSSLRDEQLKRELMLSATEVLVSIEDSRRHHNEESPYNDISYHTAALACLEALESSRPRHLKTRS